ncbi:MAG: L-ribulose-5-phosphate 3-epimerase [Verrucomicrobiota bacterium]|jgi:hexulose-6-phosphate isomerase
MFKRIGIMQGRLVPPIGERIQAFPAERWRDEFSAARAAGLASIEWIYDAGCDEVNPIASDSGLAEMRALADEHEIEVVSVCADYFMPEPLLKGTGAARAQRVEKLGWLFDRCEKAGIQRIVLPFVDNSKLETDSDLDELAALLQEMGPRAAKAGLEIHLETSLPPTRFALLLGKTAEPSVKVNYDSGNSASLGFCAEEEFAAYGSAIGSVHIKDRLLHGGTVPLGQGNADLTGFRERLEKINYEGDIILQVARGTPGDEIQWARRNRELVEQLMR